MKLNRFKIAGASSIIVIFAVLAAHTSSAPTKFTPAKPAPKQTQALSDEQQGVIAVRTAKASVVSIVGVSKNGFEQISGTGFIIDSTGYIVSNSHVVQDNQSTFDYSVIFADGSKYSASIAGVDKYNDIALVKIDRSNLAAIKLGNSDTLETGQTVFAIGNSLGKYQNTVTRGVVSGLGRDISVGSVLNPRPRLQNLVQTDAAINPGNSGGPLINISGEVIGMNTLIDTEGQGLGFAVPINMIKDAVAQLRATGKVSRAYIGITFQTIDKALQASRNLSADRGALVLAVAPGGPADNSKLQPGDIILDVNREQLNERKQLDSVIQRYQAGNQVMLSIIRNGQTTDLPLILGEYK